MKRIILLIIAVACSVIPTFAKKKNVPIDEQPRKVIPTDRPLAPAKKNVEAWIEDSLLTICFHNPEGDATITLSNTQDYDSVELTFSTEGPIVIDLAPYGEVSSFTIETESGKTYIGYL